MAKREFDYEQMAKGFLGTMKDWIDILGERNKLMVDQIGNERKAKQNFFYDIMMKEYQTPHQRQLGEQFQKQGQGAQEIQPQENVFTGQVQPEVRQGVSGYEVHHPGIEEQKFKIRLGLNQIKKMEGAGLKLNPQQQAFKQKYGFLEKELGKVSPSDWEIRKEARTTVNMKLNNNFALQTEAIENPELINQMIAEEEKNIRGGGYRSSVSAQDNTEIFPEDRDTQLPENEFEVDEELPPGTTTASAAVRYLMDSKGSTKEQAIEHLRRKNAGISTSSNGFLQRLRQLESRRISENRGAQ